MLRSTGKRLYIFLNCGRKLENLEEKPMQFTWKVHILSPELESNPDPPHYDLWGNVRTHTHTHAPSCNDVNLSNKKWRLLSVSIGHHERFWPMLKVLQPLLNHRSASIATRQVTTAYVHVKHRDCTGLGSHCCKTHLHCCWEVI